jgi:hypothetical protein
MNKQRGEIDIDLNGQKVTARPTFDAMCHIESATDKGIMRLAKDFAFQDFKTTEVADILFYGIQASGREIDRKIICDAISKHGVRFYLAPCFEFLKLALGGEDADDDKKKESVEIQN